MAKAVAAGAVLVALAGTVFAYSAIKGKSIPDIARALINGANPSSVSQSNPITTPVDTGSGAEAATSIVPALTVGADVAGGSSTGARANAVAYAYAQIGKPYVFDKAGPDSFDCSGLTMMAWKYAGIDVLQHYTVLQYQETTHIPLDEAQPGDIMLISLTAALRAAPHHVILYIGDGNCIEAYDVGYPVRVAPISEYNKQVITVGQMPV